MSDAQLRIGRRLRRLLEDYPITREELAEKLGVTPNMLWRYLTTDNRASKPLVLLLDRVEDEIHARFSEG